MKIEYNKTQEGFEYTSELFKIFFANKNATEEFLKNRYSLDTLCFMRQVHGNKICVSSPTVLPECDGITTTKILEPLVVKTADCLPIMIFSDGRIFAIHAGWRGLVNPVLYSIKQFIKPKNNFFAFIGPHIGFNSFAVKEDVVLEVESFLKKYSLKFDKKKLFKIIVDDSSVDKSQFLLNLEYLAQMQLLSLGINETNIYSTKVDTFTDKNWHSYRRDGVAAGRNLHLIFKI